MIRDTHRLGRLHPRRRGAGGRHRHHNALREPRWHASYADAGHGPGRVLRGHLRNGRQHPHVEPALAGMRWRRCSRRPPRPATEVLGVFISTGLSGAYEGAVRAARAVAVPQHRLRLRARRLQRRAATTRRGRCSMPWPPARPARTLRAARSAVLAGIESTRFLFTPETLTFLQKGGRIGNAAALLGNLIQLSPVLTVSDGQGHDPREGAHAQEGAREDRGRRSRHDVEKPTG